MGKAADQAVNSALADIRATKARIEADIDAVRGAADDPIGMVMSLAGSDRDPGGAVPGGFDTDKAAATARQVAPKAAAAVGALGLTGVLAKRSKGKRARKKADAKQRKDARIRAEELARAFGGSMPADAADAHLEAEQQAAATEQPEQPDKKSRKGTFALVLLAAAAAGAAAVYLSGRR